MPTRRAAAPAKKKRGAGLQPKMFKGLNKKRLEQKSGAGKRVTFSNDNPTVTVQFMNTPDKFVEYENHAFQEEGRWCFVPCAGDECPLCDSESDSVRKTAYRFICNVWDAKEGKVKVLEGPKTLGGAIFYRYQRKPSAFLKRVFDITKFPTTPVTYNFELAEEDTVSLAGKKGHDLEAYLLDQLKQYYGDDLNISPVTLEDEDDDEEEDDLDDDELEDELDEEDEADEDEDEEEDDEDEDDEDFDDEEEDEDEDEEDEPPARRKPVKKAAVAKKAAAKKAPAKKVAAKARR